MVFPITLGDALECIMGMDPNRQITIINQLPGYDCWYIHRGEAWEAPRDYDSSPLEGFVIGDISQGLPSDDELRYYAGRSAEPIVLYICEPV
jgi:hypothetical protein